MPELILKMSMSIDGFVGDPDGGIKWIFNGDQEAMAWTAETVWNAGLHIMGSRTFREPRTRVPGRDSLTRTILQRDSHRIMQPTFTPL
jgi:hypothetical protein